MYSWFWKKDDLSHITSSALDVSLYICNYGNHHTAGQRQQGNAEILFAVYNQKQ